MCLKAAFVAKEGWRFTYLCSHIFTMMWLDLLIFFFYYLFSIVVCFLELECPDVFKSRGYEMKVFPSTDVTFLIEQLLKWHEFVVYFGKD